MLRKHIERIVRFPVTIIILAIFATAFFAYQFKDLHMVLDPKAILPQDHPYVKLNNEIEKQFGGSRVVVIGVASKDGDIFNPQDVEKIRLINEEAKKLPGILENNVVSIADRKVKYVKAEGDSLEIKGLLEGIEYTPEGMAVLKQRVYSNPMFINSLISADGTVAAIILDFKGGAGDWWQKTENGERQKSEVRSKKQEGVAWAEEDWKKWQGGKPAEGQGGKWPTGGKGGWPASGGGEKEWEQWYVSDATIHKKVLEIVDKYKDANTEIYVGGLPVALSFLEADSWRMSRYIYPLALFIIMFVLYFAFRSIQGMILPIVCALLSVVWAVGLMGVFKIPLDPWNMMTPILILAVAAGHSVQILKRYYEELESEKSEVRSQKSDIEPKEADHEGRRYSSVGVYPPQDSSESHWGAEISRQAVVASLTKIGPVMITAGIVAAASFASLLTFKLKTFQSFGLFTAFGILSALILEMTFIPAARSLMRPPRKGAGQRQEARGKRQEGTPSPLMGEGRSADLYGRPQELSILDRFLLSVSNLVSNRSWLVWLGLVVVIAISFYGIHKLTIINSLKGLFFESTQFRKDDAALNKYFGGTATFYVYIEGQPDSLKDPAVLRAIEGLQHEIESVPEVGKTQSYVDYVKAMNQSMHGGDAAYRTIPDEQATISEYLFLFSISGSQGEMDRFLDYQYQKSVIWVFLRDDSTVLGEKLISIVKKYAPGEKSEARSQKSEILPSVIARAEGPKQSEKEIASHPSGARNDMKFPPGIKVGVAGSIPVMMALNQTMVSGKIWNILQIAGIVFAITSIVLRSPVGGILVLLPLGIAVLVNFGVLGIAGIGLGVGTAAISAMAVGFGADYSIYLLYRLREEVRGKKQEARGKKQEARGEKEEVRSKTEDMDDAVQKTLLTAGKAIIFVALALAAGGVTLLFTGYYLHMEGFLVPLAMLTSSLATLIVLPAVVALVKPGFIYR
ncbi:MAG: MMPL family transporter [Nitrospirae bacterium]|nr:MMPL family transporter [Nitrospirota bacterium]